MPRWSTLRPGAAGAGTVYVATPQLLRAFGIKASQVSPRADILSMRPGLSGITKMQLSFAGKGPPGAVGPAAARAHSPARSQCLANPVIQEVSALPSGTSAPNTVITEHAISTLGLQPGVPGGRLADPDPAARPPPRRSPTPGSPRPRRA